MRENFAANEETKAKYLHVKMEFELKKRNKINRKHTCTCRMQYGFNFERMQSNQHAEKFNYVYRCDETSK